MAKGQSGVTALTVICWAASFLSRARPYCPPASSHCRCLKNEATQRSRPRSPSSFPACATHTRLCTHAQLTLGHKPTQKHPNCPTPHCSCTIHVIYVPRSPCWATSAQRRCHPEEALYLPTFSHLFDCQNFSLSLFSRPPPTQSLRSFVLQK
jgi:hypothetical protein